MSTPFLGEIKMTSFVYAPKGWAMCNGQLLSITQNTALFSLLGTSYGGDGKVNFGLPNLQAQIPVHMGSGYTLGQRAGESTHTLTQVELAAHTHLVKANAGSGDQPAPNQHVPASVSPATFGTANDVAMSAGAVTTVGGSQAHDNMPPYLVVNFIIALQGIFPSQN